MAAHLGVADVAPRPPQIVVLLLGPQRAPGDVSALFRLLLVVCRRLLVIPRVGVLAPLADLGAVLPEQEGDAAAREAEEREQRAGPLVAEAVVHLLGEEDDAGAPEAADAGLGGEGGGGLVLVRVDEVVVGGVVEEDEAEADGEAAEGGADPVQARVGGPGEDEEADGDEPAGEHHGDEAGLGGRVAVVAGGELEVVLVDHGGAGGGHEDADGDRDEHEAGGGGGPALAALVDDGVGDEEHVEEAVEDGHVEGDEEDDELAEEELEGADEEDAEAGGEGAAVEFLLGDVGRVTGLLAESGGAAGEDRGRVGLRDGECDEDPDDEGEDQLDVVEPAPAEVICEEAADKGANCDGVR